MKACCSPERSGSAGLARSATVSARDYRLGIGAVADRVNGLTWAPDGATTSDRSQIVIVLGIICLVIGFLVGIPVLWTIGIILVVIGAIFWILGAAGHAVGGRKVWY